MQKNSVLTKNHFFNHVFINTICIVPNVAAKEFVPNFGRTSTSTIPPSTQQLQPPQAGLNGNPALNVEANEYSPSPNPNQIHFIPPMNPGQFQVNPKSILKYSYNAYFNVVCICI